MRFWRAAIAPLFLLVACATASVEKEPWPIASARRTGLAGEQFGASVSAAQFGTSIDCEREARRLRVSSPSAGWSLLKTCVDRGDFSHLELLADPFWAEDLRMRSDAPALLCHAIAAQGGSVHHDLALLHQQHIPLFSLADAVSAPEVYAGRNVVLRGRIHEIRSDAGSATAKLEEVEVRSAAFEFPVGSGYRSRTQGRDALGFQSWSLESSAHRTFRKYDNLTQETGREALLRIPGTDPFLEPGQEFIIVSRFDGAKMTSSGNEVEAELIPVLSLISYRPPSPLALY